MTFLDFVGFYDCVTRLKSMGILPDFEWRICSDRAEVGDDRGAAGMRMRADSVLEQALLLGLCTAYQYDPARPVLWTRASLTRRVELYEPAGFYA